MTALQDALTCTRRVAGLTDSALVALSGGKDSLATLDVVMRGGFKRVEAFFMYLVPGLECVEAPIDRLCTRYGITLHKVPHFDLARLHSSAVLSFDGMGSVRNMRNLKIGDIEALLRQRTGIDWIAYGWKGVDGMQRRLVLRQFTDVYMKGRKFFPVSTWRDRDVYAYLRTRKIPVPAKAGGGLRADGGQAKGTGVSLAAHELLWMKNEHPADYARVIAAFPFADATVWELEHGKETPQGGASHG